VVVVDKNRRRGLERQTKRRNPRITPVFSQQNDAETISGSVNPPTESPRRSTSGALLSHRVRVRRRGQLMMNSLLVLLIAVAAGGVWFLSIERRYQDRIYPNISILGVNVGGLSKTEATQALVDHLKPFRDTPIVLSYEGRNWNVSGTELGMDVSYLDSIDQAFTIGRSRDMLTNMETIWQVMKSGLEIPVTVVVDERKTQESVARLVPIIDRPAQDPAVILDGASLRFVGGAVGRMILIDETVARIREVLPLMAKQQPVTVATRELPMNITQAAKDAAQQRMTALVGQPLVVRVGDTEYTWTSDELSRMVEYVQTDSQGGPTGYTLSLNPYMIERRIDKIAEETQTRPVYPRVKWDMGVLTITKPGVPGWRLNKQEARDLITTTIDNGVRNVTLVPRYVPIPINETNLNTLGIVDLVSEGKSDFSGSAAYRVTNIQAGLKVLDGVLIPPGDEFSFNETIGAIDETQGFVEGYAIVQQRTQLEFGGGICQDSTTVFRAAFWAGLPITERWGHSFYISWYDKYGPTGMDSTIFTGGPDLKFLNDTGKWLLIQTSSNPKTGIASVKFYGTPTGRKVEMIQNIYNRVTAPVEPVFVTDAEQPAGAVKQSDRARDGITIDISRTIIDPDGTVRAPEIYRTRFKPWPNIYVFNPADLENGIPKIEMPEPQGNLNTPGVTAESGVRYITSSQTAPVEEAPKPTEAEAP
jgi:vancomycin resistance protein YoaR